MNQKDLDVLVEIFGADNVVVFDGGRMEGTILRVLGDKKFGFIKGEDGTDYFFHQSDLNGFFDDLVADVNNAGRKVKVSFVSVPSSKGPRASEVTRLDSGV